MFIFLKRQFVKWVLGKCKHFCFCCKYKNVCLKDGDWWKI